MVDKATFVKQMVDGTMEHVTDHAFTLQTHYIVCGRRHRNLFPSLLAGTIPGPRRLDGKGMPHTTCGGVEIVSTAKNLKCKAYAVAKGGEHVASRALMKSCASGQQSQTTLPICFRPKEATEL